MPARPLRTQPPKAKRKSQSPKSEVTPKKKPIKKAKAEKPKEWEDEEVTVPMKPILPQSPNQPVNDPDIDAPEPPPIRNESGEDSLVEAKPYIAIPTFEVSELLNDPNLWQDAGKIQRLVVNISVLGYISNESIANSLLKIHDTMEALVQANVLIAQTLTSATELLSLRGVDYGKKDH